MTDFVRLFHERLGTAVLADAAFRVGLGVLAGPAGLSPLAPAKIAGPVRSVRARNDLVSILAAVDRAGPGEVVVIAGDGAEAGLIGDLVAAEAKRKALAGFVVDGCVRDGDDIVAMGVPVFCRGRVPVGPLKLDPGLRGIGEVDVPVQIGDVTVRPGSWAFGDGDGVIFLEAAGLAQIFTEAGRALDREAALREALASGRSLGDLLQLSAFLEDRERDPAADFTRHLTRLRSAI